MGAKLAPRYGVRVRNLNGDGDPSWAEYALVEGYFDKRYEALVECEKLSSYCPWAMFGVTEVLLPVTTEDDLPYTLDRAPRG